MPQPASPPGEASAHWVVGAFTGTGPYAVDASVVSQGVQSGLRGGARRPPPHLIPGFATDSLYGLGQVAASFSVCSCLSLGVSGLPFTRGSSMRTVSTEKSCSLSAGATSMPTEGAKASWRDLRGIEGQEEEMSAGQC